MASLQSVILQFFIRRQNIFGGKAFDPVALRARTERAVPGFSTPHPKVKVERVDADGVPSEWLIPPDAPADRALLYIHGGAWFMCSTETHRRMVSTLAYSSGIRALSINYRLAPEHPFPAALDDCITAYEWLLKKGISPEKIVIGGDSAGGNLALALLVALRDTGRPLPAGAVALSPATDLTGSGESYKTRLHSDPLFHATGSGSSIVPDYVGSHDPRHPWISPLFADLHGLPPLLIHVGDREMLLDDSVRFVDCAKAAGVDAKVVMWPEMFHVFQIYPQLLPEARRSLAGLGAFIRQRLNNP